MFARPRRALRLQGSDAHAGRVQGSANLCGTRRRPVRDANTSVGPCAHTRNPKHARTQDSSAQQQHTHTHTAACAAGAHGRRRLGGDCFRLAPPCHPARTCCCTSAPYAAATPARSSSIEAAAVAPAPAPAVGVPLPVAAAAPRGVAPPGSVLGACVVRMRVSVCVRVCGCNMAGATATPASTNMGLINHMMRLTSNQMMRLTSNHLMRLTSNQR